MSLLKLTSDRIKSLYDLHNEEIAKGTLIRTTQIIIRIRQVITEEQINDFFNRVENGEYGIFHRYPTWLSSAYQKYIIDRLIKKHSDKML